MKKPNIKFMDEQFNIRKDETRKRLLKYTRKAFRMLPQMDKPKILDIGCGSGIPTLELARLGQGEVIGIDIDQPAMDKLATRIKETGLTSRVQAINCSILDMTFPDASFDIIWSEGSIYAIGFERGLRDWKRLLKPDGYMVIHDEQGNVREKLGLIAASGFELLGHFSLSKEEWHSEYFVPLENLIIEYQTIYADASKGPEEFQQARREIDMFKKNPERNSSAFFLMKG
ncbi:class I SAM-dependent methyltransferase [Chloroflexota bacterium]